MYFRLWIVCLLWTDDLLMKSFGKVSVPVQAMEQGRIQTSRFGHRYQQEVVDRATDLWRIESDDNLHLHMQKVSGERENTNNLSPEVHTRITYGMIRTILASRHR